MVYNLPFGRPCLQHGSSFFVAAPSAAFRKVKGQTMCQHASHPIHDVTSDFSRIYVRVSDASGVWISTNRQNGVVNMTVGIGDIKANEASWKHANTDEQGLKSHAPVIGEGPAHRTNAAMDYALPHVQCANSSLNEPRKISLLDGV